MASSSFPASDQRPCADSSRYFCIWLRIASTLLSREGGGRSFGQRIACGDRHFEFGRLYGPAQPFELPDAGDRDAQCHHRECSFAPGDRVRHCCRSSQRAPEETQLDHQEWQVRFGAGQADQCLDGGLRELGQSSVLPIRSEAFGQRHFIVPGPDGVLIDVITNIPPEGEFTGAYAS